MNNIDFKSENGKDQWTEYYYFFKTKEHEVLYDILKGRLSFAIVILTVEAAFHSYILADASLCQKIFYILSLFLLLTGIVFGIFATTGILELYKTEQRIAKEQRHQEDSSPFNTLFATNIKPNYMIRQFNFYMFLFLSLLCLCISISIPVFTLLFTQYLYGAVIGTTLIIIFFVILLVITRKIYHKFLNR